MTMVMLIFLSNDIAVALYLYRNTVSPKESEVDLLVISILGLERMERRYVLSCLSLLFYVESL